VKLFWEVAEGLSQPERARVLQFATGSTRVPPGGFAKLRGSNGLQPFTLSMDAAAGALGRLPTASTCFNQLKFPPYTSAAVLRQKLMLATRLGTEGFGFA
jgi:E3 ubiquitin-protein ligase HUWE1